MSQLSNAFQCKFVLFTSPAWKCSATLQHSWLRLGRLEHIQIPGATGQCNITNFRVHSMWNLYEVDTSFITDLNLCKLRQQKCRTVTEIWRFKTMMSRYKLWRNKRDPQSQRRRIPWSHIHQTHDSTHLSRDVGSERGAPVIWWKRQAACVPERLGVDPLRWLLRLKWHACM